MDQSPNQENDSSQKTLISSEISIATSKYFDDIMQRIVKLNDKLSGMDRCQADDNFSFEDLFFHAIRYLELGICKAACEVEEEHAPKMIEELREYLVEKVKKLPRLSFILKYAKKHAFSNDTEEKQ